ARHHDPRLLRGDHGASRDVPFLLVSRPSHDGWSRRRRSGRLSRGSPTSRNGLATIECYDLAGGRFSTQSAIIGICAASLIATLMEGAGHRRRRSSKAQDLLQATAKELSVSTMAPLF